jgi:hypothetical protein
MKTIKQIADELGVTKDSLKKRLNREPLKNAVEPHLETVNGIKYITEKGCEIIKNAYTSSGDTAETSPGTNGDTPVLSPPKSQNNPTQTPGTSGDNPTFSGDKTGDSGDNQKLIDMLQIQLDRKDKQIDELNARLEDTTTALVAAQQTAATAQALHAGTLQQQLIGSSATNEPTVDTLPDTPDSEEPSVKELYKLSAAASNNLQKQLEKMSDDELRALESAIPDAHFLLLRRKRERKRGFFGLFR